MQQQITKPLPHFPELLSTPKAHSTPGGDQACFQVPCITRVDVQKVLDQLLSHKESLEDCLGRSLMLCLPLSGCIRRLSEWYHSVGVGIANMQCWASPWSSREVVWLPQGVAASVSGLLAWQLRGQRKCSREQGRSCVASSDPPGQPSWSQE